MISFMADTIKELRNALAEFDGRALTIVSEAGAKFSDREDYLDSLVTLCCEGGKGTSVGATWLLKSYLDGGGELPADQISRWISQIEEMQNWMAQLLLCQSIQYLTVCSKDADRLVKWLQPLLNHKRPFLRAWSLDALFRISVQYPELDDMVKLTLHSGLEDPAASVRARARNLKN